MARRHCQIFVGTDIVTIRDLNSGGGTFVNGQRILGDQVLADGDHLRIGQLEFEVIMPVVGDSSPSGDTDILAWLEKFLRYRLVKRYGGCGWIIEPISIGPTRLHAVTIP